MPFRINLFPWPLNPWFQWKKYLGLEIYARKHNICIRLARHLCSAGPNTGFDSQAQWFPLAVFSLKHLVSVHTSWVLSWVYRGYHKPCKFKCRAQLKQLLSFLFFQTTLPPKMLKFLLTSWNFPQLWWKLHKPSMVPSWFENVLLAHLLARFKCNSISKYKYVPHWELYIFISRVVRNREAFFVII